MTWPNVKLGEHVVVQNGYAFKSEEYAEFGHFVMRITNVQQGYISNNNPKYVAIQDNAKLKQFILDEGDILMSLTGDVGRVGVIKKNHLPAVLNQRVAKLKITSKAIDKNYLFWFLNSESTRIKIESHGYGAAQKNVSSKQIELLEIPLPPLAEQQRIASILDKADLIKHGREFNIEKLGLLAGSIFFEMFGNPNINNKNLRMQNLGEILKVKSGNFLPNNAMESDGKYPVYGGNGINGYHDSYMFEDKKIVIGRVGAYCGCVHVTHQQSWVTDNALYVDEFSNELNFEYLAFALDIANLNKVSSQSGQPLVSGARIYRVNILVPPLEDQAIFVKKLKLIDSHKIKNQRSSSLIKDILSSLKTQAFSGQL